MPFVMSNRYLLNHFRKTILPFFGLSYLKDFLINFVSEMDIRVPSQSSVIRKGVKSTLEFK